MNHSGNEAWSQGSKFRPAPKVDFPFLGSGCRNYFAACDALCFRVKITPIYLATKPLWSMTFD